MTPDTSLLGLTLEEALGRLRAAGVEPEVSYTRSPRREAAGTARVVRVMEEGKRLTAALFPDQLKDGGEGA